jgi:hypothetical protein
MEAVRQAEAHLAFIDLSRQTLKMVDPEIS